MRNSVSNFQLAIKSYLDELSLIDEQFAAKYRSEEKSIEKCCAFIISEMKKLAQNNVMGATDDEVYGLALHYYLEDKLDADLQFTNNVLVVSNQFVDLTEEEKAEAKKAAIAQYQKEELQKLQSRKKPVVKKEIQVQPSLFD
jgi:carbamate kinase